MQAGSFDFYAKIKAFTLAVDFKAAIPNGANPSIFFDSQFKRHNNVISSCNVTT